MMFVDKVQYAIYSSDLRVPLARFDIFKDLQQDSIDKSHFVVTEVSEKRPDGKLVIKQLRVVSGPKVWIPATFIPEYDGEYLCFLIRKNECGTLSKHKYVLEFKNMKWAELFGDVEVTHWMIIENP